MVKVYVNLCKVIPYLFCSTKIIAFYDPTQHTIYTEFFNAIPTIQRQFFMTSTNVRVRRMRPLALNNSLVMIATGNKTGLRCMINIKEAGT